VYERAPIVLGILSMMIAAANLPAHIVTKPALLDRALQFVEHGPVRMVPVA
jgi:hypothetical protein